MNDRDAEFEALNKSGLFDEQWYLSEYPDVKDTGMNAARHFLSIGKFLGRMPRPRAPAESLSRVSALYKLTRRVSLRSQVDPHIYDTIATEFDETFYISSYPDIETAGVDPVWHYMTQGWLEGRDPSHQFSTRYYLETNPDVEAAQINPLYHYVIQGRTEGRAPRHQLGFRYDVLARLKPVAEQIAIAKAHRASVSVGSAAALRSELAKALTSGRRPMLSFSHDDFSRHVGGVQMLMRRELQMLKDLGWLQINIYPVHPLAFLDTSGEDVLLGVTISGRSVGAFRPVDVTDVLHALPGADSFFVIHNLLGHNMDQVISVIEAFGARSGYFWIHDFAALYNNFVLMRNNVVYNGVPRPGTMGWDLCEFARADFSHPAEFAKLFTRFSIDLISPSQSALQIWEAADLHKARSNIIIEHCTLSESSRTPPAQIGPIEPDEPPLKIGFLGHPAVHKGWPFFRELVLAFAQDTRYSFYHLGSGGSEGLPVVTREVIADVHNPDRMRAAVADANLDVALVWSLWPETFCLVAYEAVAGGAALLTNVSAGNVCALVQNTGEGAVFEGEKALLALFESGEIRRYARSRRTVRSFDIAYSALTAGQVGPAQ